MEPAGARLADLALVGLISVGVGLGFGVLDRRDGRLLGGKIDAVLMRITEAVWTFPALMLALAITSVLGRGLFNSMLAIGIVASRSSPGSRAPRR